MNVKGWGVVRGDAGGHDCQRMVRGDEGGHECQRMVSGDPYTSANFHKLLCERTPTQAQCFINNYVKEPLHKR